MQYLQIALTALFSVAVLFIMTKLIGYRQLSQLSMFDYINGITIGSIAAELSTAKDEEFWNWLIALAVYGVAAFILSALTDKSIVMRRAITGKPVILFKNSKMYDKNFRTSKIDVNEFLMQCRNSGYFDLAQIDTAVLEPNGKISFLPKSQSRPATPEDLNLSVSQDELPANVIIDGKVMTGNLKAIGYNIEWLKKELKKQNSSDIQDIFLATCTLEGGLAVYTRGGKAENCTLE